MAKLKKYSARAIFTRVGSSCYYTWSEKRIREYLKKNGEKKVDALWIAKRKDIKRTDKLWILLRDGIPELYLRGENDISGLTPQTIRHKTREFLSRFDIVYGDWWRAVVINPNVAKNGMRMLVKLLEKENEKRKS